MNSPARNPRAKYDSPSKLCANPYKVLRVADPVDSIVDGSKVTIAAVKVFCTGPIAEVGLMLGDAPAQESKGTIKIGEHFCAGPKCVELPHDGLHVSPIPVNPQDPSWGDTFFAKVVGRKLFVSRIDGGGDVWGQDLQLTWTRRPYVEIIVGQSETATRTITLPNNLPWSDYQMSTEPLNEQGDGWTDAFSAEMNGNDLTIRRTDQEAGWAQPLRLAAFRNL
eukprot:CAMPEP_0182927096 /NCGR_PEP_ID=MMETSP0105_2-20130417/13165_1 /TAXON_ID=81532 ORGANISM="Acanthoeca-like sp., Strain 10tr" /NCGR_SAMPLE_ID=MMETSP0105_2 /ASSEMBLY_ACC=CAM_ASM_000205 /LENGTH=221 /DNA_ID=CAMNT_0025065023 /DNA_START=35 /DNA_END=700 /DNA_ORIENTATION=-